MWSWNNFQIMISSRPKNSLKFWMLSDWHILTSTNLSPWWIFLVFTVAALLMRWAPLLLEILISFVCSDYSRVIRRSYLGKSIPWTKSTPNRERRKRNQSTNHDLFRSSGDDLFWYLQETFQEKRTLGFISQDSFAIPFTHFSSSNCLSKRRAPFTSASGYLRQSSQPRWAWFHWLFLLSSLRMRSQCLATTPPLLPQTRFL